MVSLWLLGSAFGGEKIVNGQEAFDGQFPEVVAVLAGGSTCTGSLIAPDTVLTAAHCFDDFSDPSSGDDVRIAWGLETRAPDEVVSAASVEIHANYVSIEATGSAPRNDIALVTLVKPVSRPTMPLNPTPIDFASWEDVSLRFAGYGDTFSDAGDSGTLRWVDVPVSDVEEQVVFVFDNEHNTCQGDSGGPGLYVDGDRYIQVGITSYGGQDCQTSESGAVRVDAYLDWIRERVPNISTQPASPPSFSCSHQLNPDDPQTIAFGTTPMTLRCSVSGDLDDLTAVEWSWGDRTVETLEPDDASHTYTETGVYTVTACFSGEREGTPFEQCVRRPNHVHACGAPEPAFDAHLEGKELVLRNLTPLNAPTCITNAQWDVFRDGEDTPVQTVSGWEPALQVDDAGPWRVVLHVGGVGGTGASEALVERERGIGCSITAGLTTLWTLPLVLVAGRRRRKD